MIRGNGKFLVVKNADLDRYLDSHQEDNLFDIVQTVEAGRISDGKVEDNQYLVINQDEPYVNEVIEIMKRHGHWS
ncbi:hypothetical protein MTP04_24600 [Lysinibacillus sp. PLM2]|nr:hypothetical protein MTP04_24600 [Lysinibacillus sp. PLM2]